MTDYLWDVIFHIFILKLEITRTRSIKSDNIYLQFRDGKYLQLQLQSVQYSL